MLEELKQQVYEANMELPRRSLVTYTWGNVSGIDREKGLSYFEHNEADYMDIIHCFIEQYGEQKTKLERFYEEKDWENYKIGVHSLKGQSLTIGAESLSEKAKHLQEAAQKKDEAYIAANHGPFMEEYQEIMDGLEERKPAGIRGKLE